MRIELPARDLVAEALREGRGVVLVTGHFGNWDIAARTLENYDRPINVVMAREANATTQEYMRAIREQAGVRVIYSDSSVFSSLNMIRALRNNEIVAIQLDRMLGVGGDAAGAVLRRTGARSRPAPSSSPASPARRSCPSSFRGSAPATTRSASGTRVGLPRDARDARLARAGDAGRGRGVRGHRPRVTRISGSSSRRSGRKTLVRRPPPPAASPPFAPPPFRSRA